MILSISCCIISLQHRHRRNFNGESLKSVRLRVNDPAKLVPTEVIYERYRRSVSINIPAIIICPEDERGTEWTKKKEYGGSG